MNVLLSRLYTAVASEGRGWNSLRQEFLGHWDWNQFSLAPPNHNEPNTRTLDISITILCVICELSKFYLFSFCNLFISVFPNFSSCQTENKFLKNHKCNICFLTVSITKSVLFIKIMELRFSTEISILEAYWILNGRFGI